MKSALFGFTKRSEVPIVIGMVCALWLWTTEQAFAQKTAKDSAEKVFLLGPSFAYQQPGGELAERFGYNFSVGGSFMLKLKSNWIFGIEGQFIFGDEEGLEIARRIDACISRLPGLHWFNLLTEMRDAAVAGA